MLRKSLLSTAGFLTLAVTLAGALRLLPEQPISAHIQPVNPSPLVLANQPAGLQPAHPDETVEETLNGRFSLPDALRQVQQIRSALNNFRQMTRQNPKLAAGIKDTDWETQNLGFTNWPNSIEGTMRYQDYQIKKLELDLAREQFEDGKIPKATLEQKLAAFQTSERAFQSFWRSFRIAD